MKRKASRDYRFRDREHDATKRMLESGDKCICFRCASADEAARIEKAVAKNLARIGCKSAIVSRRCGELLYIINVGAVTPIQA